MTFEQAGLLTLAASETDVLHFRSDSKAEGRADQTGCLRQRDQASYLIDFAPWADCFFNPSLFSTLWQPQF
jgi:hypothetical protein